jgi:hypothetical protein
MKNTKGIKWRLATPAVRAATAAGSIAALIAATGAPWKWY